jgi:hypothetical protein
MESQARTLVKLGDFYEKQMFLESKKTFPGKNTFKLATKKKADAGEAEKEPFINKNSGPAKADGFRKDIIDPQKSKKDFPNSKNFSSDTINLKEKAEKKEIKNINTSMSKPTTKSIFDKLYEDVMQNDNFQDGGSFGDEADADALGLGDSSEGEGDLGGEEGSDEKTLVKDLYDKVKELAEKLGVDLEGGEEAPTEGSPEEEPKLEGEDESSDDFGGGEDNEEKKKKEKEVAKEGVDIKELKDSAGKSLQNKNNKVGDETSKLVSKGEGDGSIKDEAQASPKNLPDGKSKLQSKNNKVDSKTSKVGEYLAGLK